MRDVALLGGLRVCSLPACLLGRRLLSLLDAHSRLTIPQGRLPPQSGWGRCCGIRSQVGVGPTVGMAGVCYGVGNV